MSKVLVIDIGATNMRFGVFADDKVHVLRRIRTPKSEARLHDYLINQSKKIVQKIAVNGIALSVAGPVLHQNKIYLSHITQSHIDIKTPIFKEFKLPVTLINDTDAAVMAEQKYGFGKGCKSLIYVTFSTGVGGGVIENDKLREVTRVKDEISHQKIDSKYGAPCYCGGVGHWSSFISGAKIVNTMRIWSEVTGRRFSPIIYTDVKRIFWLAGLGDNLAKDFLDEVGRMNAKAIDIFIEKFHPEVFVIGGSIALNNSEVILSGIKKYQKSKVPVRITKLGDEISLLGAAVYFETRNKG
ncbi:MAG: ROK family protein [Patescibacteria group bacterium]|nr:ROK family protein [Patescibacteria group bacterium]